MRRLLAVLLFLVFLSTPLFASTTQAERIANDAAQHELDSSSPNGNVPSYSLKPADLAKGQHLEKVRNVLHFGNALWGLLQLVLLLSLGVIGYFRNLVVAKFKNRWLQGYGFLLLLLAVTELLGLPVDIYGHWLSRSYGLSVQSWVGWAADQAKQFALSWVFGGLMVMLLFWIIRKFPNRWWVVFWLVIMPITIATIYAEPYVIEPLFNKFEPLAKSNPELVKRIEEVAQRGNMNIPPERMFLMKASEKVTTLNAYVSGFGGSKRVVVWDTSIAKGTPDEILFIFGHESGHYVLHHIVRGVLISFVTTFLLLYLGFLFVRWSIARFGSSWGIPSQNDWGALVVLMLAFTLMSFVLEPVESTLTRQQEHAADVYGQEAVHGLVANPQETARAAFQVLGETSFDDPNPSQFIEFWTYSHPSIGRRAAFAAHYDPWTDGMEPKYFPKP
jgi:Zn-dependent protease with chaperone function